MAEPPASTGCEGVVFCLGVGSMGHVPDHAMRTGPNLIKSEIHARCAISKRSDQVIGRHGRPPQACVLGRYDCFGNFTFHSAPNDSGSSADHRCVLAWIITVSWWPNRDV